MSRGSPVRGRDRGRCGGLDIGAILSPVASGGVGGGVLMAVVGVIRNTMAKS